MKNCLLWRKGIQNRTCYSCQFLPRKDEIQLHINFQILDLVEHLGSQGVAKRNKLYFGHVHCFAQNLLYGLKKVIQI